MKNVILIGANGATMRVLTEQLKDNADVHLTLFYVMPSVSTSAKSMSP
ncbi:hypothetical protein [Lacticaseibacillus saniviri]|nr:hypothetical protein [Lacticaseibacillus saniviri]